MSRLILVISVCLGSLTPSWGGAKEKFIVHEWGVWIRTAVRVRPFSQKGELRASQEARPHLSAPSELFDELPKMVLLHRNHFTPQPKSRAWKKPILHFYGRAQKEVSVRIDLPQGVPLAYWPRAKLLERTRWQMGSGRTEAVGLKWRGALKAKAPATLEEVPSKHWWNKIRAVPGLYFDSEGGSERFIFYEATALQEPLIAGRVGLEEITLRNVAPADSGPVILIANDGATLSWRQIKNIPAWESVQVKRDLFLGRQTHAKGLLEACHAQWQAFGMTPQEAAAIVETWREDLTSRPGMLLIGRLPVKTYDKIFPLTITPKPDELIRAGVIFDALPGEKHRTAWLPGLNASMKKWERQLDQEDFGIRKQAADRFAQLGDLALPYLKRMAASESLEISNAAKSLLKRQEIPIISTPLGPIK